MLNRLSLTEIFLLEWIVWQSLWLVHEYVALLLTIILTAIVWGVLIVALVSERIERSKVPRKYFYIMAVSGLAPLVAAGIHAFFLR